MLPETRSNENKFKVLQVAIKSLVYVDRRKRRLDRR